MWRQHFLESMQPRHLPPLWSVQHQEERLGVKAADNRIDAAQYELATRGTELSCGEGTSWTRRRLAARGVLGGSSAASGPPIVVV